MIKTRRSNKINKKRGITRKRMTNIYGDMKGKDANTEGYNREFNLTYGEITQEGVEKLAEVFTSIRDISKYPKDKRVFYDVGSGIGKNVIVIASLIPEILSKGVELVKDRHAMAMNAYNSMKEESVKKRVEFINDSFYNITFNNAAWVFISNLCFSNETNVKLFEKLINELQKSALIACSKKIPFTNDSISFLGNYIIPMTWNANHELFFYEKKG